MPRFPGSGKGLRSNVAFTLLAVCFLGDAVLSGLRWFRLRADYRREQLYVDAVSAWTADVSVKAFGYPRSLRFFKQAREAEAGRVDAVARQDRIFRYARFMSAAPLILRVETDSKDALAVEGPLVADFVSLSLNMLAKNDGRTLKLVESFRRDFGCNRHRDLCEPLLRAAIALARRQTPTNLAVLSGFEIELAMILQSQGLEASNTDEHRAAELRLREALALESNVVSRNEPGREGLEGARFWLGYALLRAGRTAEAVRLLETLVARMKRGNVHSQSVHESQQLLARGLGQVGRFADSESHLLEVDRDLRKECPYRDLAISRNHDLLVELYKRWGKQTKVDEYHGPVAPDTRTPASCSGWRPKPKNR